MTRMNSSENVGNGGGVGQDNLVNNASSKAEASLASAASVSENNSGIWFCIKFRTVCKFCVLMPLGGLVLCLMNALIFQFDHIQETACKVRRNFLSNVAV